MNFNIKTGQPEKLRTNCLVLAVFEAGKLPDSTQKIDVATGGYISKVIKLGDMSGKKGQTLVLHNVQNLNADRILLVGCGKYNEFNDKAFREAIQGMATQLNHMNLQDAICCITELNVTDYDISWKAQTSVVLIASSLYKFDAYKSKEEAKKPPRLSLNNITLMVASRREVDKAEQGVKVGLALVAGLQLTKDLGNTPPNICHPTFLAKAAQKLAKSYKAVSVAILERKDLETLKMGAFLSVAQGSSQPPKLITLEYRGATTKKQQPIVLVGKGITFDTGGNSLKPPAGMIGMKYDMCGAASVLGAVTFAAELGLPLNIVGVIAAAENMPGGQASRPDDIVTTMSGITVEILNTDAEGRLVLCDALTYCERFNPKVVIDMATLTGACVTALGNYHSGLFTNYQPLANDLLAAGIVSGDKCWQMPLTDEYQKQLESNFADIANVGGPEAGSITAACFLSRFTKKYQWAHLDIAGTACRFVGKDRGATGQPVPLLAEYLLNQVK
jgi:leucyl aminopeptidase